ncbi:MAG: PQQ-binding-like beta-propeller repeat protein [Tannerella sp.]|jgi:outer membrane protein assembly factor BamB|nr:PQQ-binding-like beta-propeller repeat protein [Tannerella sp.]
MKKIVTLALLLTSVILSAQTNLQWRGENRTGIYNETGLLKSWPANGPELLWHFDGLGEGHSSVSIANNKIYLTGMTDSTGIIYVLDVNGKLLKKKAYGTEWHENYNGSRGTVTVNNGKIYLISGMGGLYCFDENSLDILWQKNVKKDFNSENIKWGINESPLIVGEKIIFTPGGKEHNVVALNKNDGKLIWSCSGEGDLSAYCSPLYVGNQQVPQIVTMTADHIIGVDIATGKKLWSYENKNRHSVHANTPVYADNMLLCTSGYGKGSVMLRLKDGGRSIEKVWESIELDSRIGAMVKIGDYAYGSGDANRYWFCVNWQTGEQTYKDNSLPIGVVIADDGMLYCYSDRGDMALVKATPEKFDLISRFKITMGTEQHWAHPVIYNGVLYVRHGNTLMAYKVK